MGFAPEYILVDQQKFSKAKLSLDNHVYKIARSTTVMCITAADNMSSSIRISRIRGSS